MPARGRMLNKDISVSVKFNALPDDLTRLLATWTLSHLDKNGVFYATPDLVKSFVFPMRNISLDAVSRSLDAMEAVGLIVRFEALGRRWMWWPGFRDNQQGLRGDREQTTFPPPPNLVKTETLCEPQLRGNLPDASGKSAAEREVQEEVEVQEEGGTQNAASAAPTSPPRKPRVSGIGLIYTKHEDPRVSAYLELIKPEITAGNAETICRRVSLDQLETWKGTLTLWAKQGWNRVNFAGMFERFDTMVNQARFTTTTTQSPQLFGRPAVVGSTRDDFERVKAILEARAREAQ